MTTRSNALRTLWLLAAALALGACGGANPGDAARATEAREGLTEAGAAEPPVSAVTEDQDPVCQMDVERDAAFRHTHDGITYGFCSQVCLEQFEADPATYAIASE